MTVGDLETAHKLAGTITKIDEMMEMEGGQSMADGMWQARGGYSNAGGGMPRRGVSYGRGSSYAGRGQHYVRAHYSRDDGMQELRDQLDDMLQDERLEDHQRTALKRAIEAMDK